MNRGGLVPQAEARVSYSNPNVFVPNAISLPIGSTPLAILASCGFGGMALAPVPRAQGLQPLSLATLVALL